MFRKTTFPLKADIPKSKMALPDQKLFSAVLAYSYNVTGPNKILPDMSFVPADFWKSAWESFEKHRIKKNHSLKGAVKWHFFIGQSNPALPQ